MGSDIHAYWEVMHKGQWFCFGEKEIGRDYDVFALMAGVRDYDDVGPVYEPRGLPEDVTELTYALYADWDFDGHTPSYLTAVELDLVWNKYRDLLEKKYYQNVKNPLLFKPYAKATEAISYDDVIEQIRLVFWFDN